MMFGFYRLLIIVTVLLASCVDDDDRNDLIGSSSSSSSGSSSSVIPDIQSGGPEGTGNPMIPIPATNLYDGTVHCVTHSEFYIDDGPTYQVALDTFSINQYEITNEEFQLNFFDLNGDGTVTKDGCYFDGKTIGPSGLTCEQAWNEALDGTGRSVISIDETGVHISDDSTGLSDWDPNFTYIMTGPGLSLYSGEPNNPVIYINWYEARAYCKYVYGVDGDLPTEAQWERAAKGTTSTSYTYPWGTTTPDCSYANYRIDSGLGPGGSDYCSKENGSTLQVGSTPKGKTSWDTGIELFDMAGNIWEYCFDWRDFNFFGSADPDWNNGLNPSNKSREGSLYRIVRGGSWDFSATYLPTANRDGVKPYQQTHFLGFRCVLNS